MRAIEVDERPAAPSSAGDEGGDGIERLIERLDPIDDFNFRHFRMRHMVAELLRRGLPPGSEAPDFDLESADGTRVRLSGLRGQPVLVHFASYTCPVTRGGVFTMRELHRLYGDRVRFLEILVRQAHPGERHGAYRSQAAKYEEACAYAAEERVPWSVLADDLDGTVQRAYGGLAAAAYLIDARGDVAFCGTWGQAPALRVAIDDLLAHEGVGVPAGQGTDRRPHLAAAIVAGQGGPLRGGRRALVDLELGFPGGNLLMAAGWLARPLLAPLALRTTRLPTAARIGLVTAVVAGAAAVGYRVVERKTANGRSGEGGMSRCV
jgi:AhpC/TSA family